MTLEREPDMAFSPEELEEQRQLEELQWLIHNPDFLERPASIIEFLGDDYLNIDAGVRDGVRECLVEIFGEKPNVYNIAVVQRAMFTGGIGIGKTTFASIALPYMVHWCLCLKDPQAFFGLLPGSRIAFMQMSTSETQAKQVLFGDIFARINHGRWFRKYPHDPKFTSQIRFPKDIWIVPGDSRETSFEGYNILGGIIDEIDSHMVTDKKDYAEAGYDTIKNRVTSRFQDRGLVILIGQMKKSVGFASRMYKEFSEEGPAEGSFARKLSIWESLGWGKFLNEDGTRNSFWFDPSRKTIINDMLREAMNQDDLMEIPRVYLKDFKNNPEKALRDHAGIPPMVGDAFISMAHKVFLCRDKWHGRFGMEDSPVGLRLDRPSFADWFVAHDSLKRVIHVDIAYSADGDALGMAMGHVRELKEVDNETKPYVVFDCLIRMRALPGTQIILSEMREIIYHLRNDRGFRIKKVTLDGFESTDTLQQLWKKKFDTEYVSIDKQILPYHDLREAIYEERIEFPRYMTYMRHGDVTQVEIAPQELLQLVDNGKKIDHPDGGSKDVSDAMAGVVYTLMGDRQYRKGMASSNAAPINAGKVELPGFKLDTSSGLSGNLGLPDMPQMPDYGSLGNMLPAPRR